jgi:glycosyltransferase involved in cell wall biosynthesis
MSTGLDTSACPPEHPLVSIVIPAHNHANFLPEAIDSVLEQDYPRIELTVVDDGSTDHTRDVLDRYAQRVEAISQPNVGQAATISREWARASGDVLSYLSADDKLLPGAVSAAVDALHQYPDCVMIYGDFYLIDPASAVVRRVSAPEISYEDMVRRLICAPGPGVFVRRSAADRTQGWDARFKQAPDLDYWLRLGLIGPFRHLPAPLAAFRVHPESTSYAAASRQSAEEPVRIVESFFSRQDLDATVRGWEREATSSAHIRAARAHLRAGRPLSGFHSFRRGITLYPFNLMSSWTWRLMLNAVMNRTGHRLLWVLRRSRRAGGWSA